MSQRPYLVVSSDSHAGPSLRTQLRPYCPSAYLESFDAFVAGVERQNYHPTWGTDHAFTRTASRPGQQDPAARLSDMDDDGVAAQVIFAGGQNREQLPFVGSGFDAGSTAFDPELRRAGDRIWNQWISEFVAAAPERLVGVLQIPIWDLDAATREIEWGREHGLWVVNFPAPRSDFAAYNDPVYERFWSLCEANEVVLVSHSAGSGDIPGVEGPGGRALYLVDGKYLGTRHVGLMIFGGVFERHPRLKLVLTEFRADWVPQRLRDFDSLYAADISEQWSPGIRGELRRRPSEYWDASCFVAASFPARHEIELRHELGMQNVMWGDDYPHVEGTWPYTRLALRNAFAGVPEAEVRRMIGELAVDVYGLDRARLEAIAERIGPTPEALSVAPDESELPDGDRVLAFRTYGSWA